MNKCIFSGRLVRAAELKRTQTDKAVCNFSIAVADGFGDSKVTTFPSFTAWGKTAEFIAKVGKGTLVEIVSRYTERAWTDREGKKRTEKEFTVEDFKRLEWDSQPEEQTAEKTYTDLFPDDDLPF